MSILETCFSDEECSNKDCKGETSMQFGLCGKFSLHLGFKKQVSMIMKCHNHTLQTNPQYFE